MTTDLAVRQSVQLSTEQLQFIANTEFVPKGLRGNMPAILACVATGRELGIGDMTALKSIHVIDGRPTFSAELMVLLVRRAGHSISGEVGADQATVKGTRADNGDTMTVTWTTEMAKRAGLLGKQNWAKYVESMLWARAVSQLCRMLFADCFAGATYTTEELEETTIDTSGEAAYFGADDSNADGVPVDDDYLFPPKDQPQPGMGAPDDDTPTVGARDRSKRTEAQAKKLNVLVGQLREGGHITTAQLWRACDLDPENGRGDDGEIHWSPLRDSLSRDQASALIDRLERYAETIEAPDA